MSSGIDAAVVLGLAGKVSQVFAEDGTYLSFPIAPIALEADALRALGTDPLGPAGAAALAEFSSLVNEVPSGRLWQPDGDRLWDVYGDVLAGAELAEQPRTAAEERDYQASFATLYRAQPDGTLSDSPAAVAYEQYRDAYLALAQEYNNRKGQADLAADPAVKQVWAADEPALLAKLTEAEQDWAVLGCRRTVEDARRVLRELGSRSPATAWTNYRKLYDPDLPEIYFRTSTEGSMFLPTGYLPSDLIESQWPTITMTAAELTALGAAAPEELRSRLGGSAAASVDQVSFEYSALTVSRPWFVPEVFASRAWRFRDPGRTLSDGGLPPAGECPGYVASLVLARNLTVHKRGGGGLGFLAKPGARPTRPYSSATLKSRLAARHDRQVTRQTAGTGTASAAKSAATGGRTATVRSAAGGHRAGGRTTAARSGTGGYRAGSGTASAGKSVGGTVVRAAAKSVGGTAGGYRAAAPAVPANVPGKRDVTGYRTAPRPAPPAGSQATSTDPGQVYVLAFVCRALPKSPDPDPALNWD